MFFGGVVAILLLKRRKLPQLFYFSLYLALLLGTNADRYVNPSRPDPGQREKNNLNLYFQTSL